MMVVAVAHDLILRYGHIEQDSYIPVSFFGNLILHIDWKILKSTRRKSLYFISLDRNKANGEKMCHLKRH